MQGKLKAAGGINNRRSVIMRLIHSKELYLFCLPGIVLTLIFHYWPLYGVQIAFRNFTFHRGIWGSEWVGLEHFARFFRSPHSLQIIWNTFILSFYALLVSFPIPIIFALMLNSFRHKKYGKVIQSVACVPHFISVVVMAGMLMLFLSPRMGMLGWFFSTFSVEPVNLLGMSSAWRHVYVWSGVWQGMGWGAVVYIAALSGVSPELHEAAIVDGTNKLQRIIHIDLPSIMPVAVMLLILSAGTLFSIGFEKAFALQNPMNISVSEIIPTYVYRMGIMNHDMSFAAAVGLFNSLVNAALLVAVNFAARKLTGHGIW